MSDGKTQERAEHVSDGPGKAKVYGRFAAMVGVATFIMYFLMYLNTYRWDHLFFSEERAYMALIMGAMMATVMLSFMLRMHPDRRINAGIYIGSVLLFVLALWLVRSQRTIQDVSYMKAMIPHHSIAILTSERAQISDPRVRELADQIIESQRQEIAQMKALIADIEANGVARAAQPGDSAWRRKAHPQHPLAHLPRQAKQTYTRGHARSQMVSQ